MGKGQVWLGVLLATAMLVGQAVSSAAADPDRGRVLFALAGGCGCHTGEDGSLGAGGRALPTPFGTFYGTNITPDPDTGIGGWTDAEIIAAIRRGNARGKGVEAPVMPYYLYAGMADSDVEDLVAYLRALPPVRRENRPPEVKIPFQRLAYRAWRFLFAPPVRPAARAPRGEVERGRYLADHVAICQDCHTPRNRFGAPVADMYLAGTSNGPDGRPVPNITSDAKTGVGKWDVYDLTRLLSSGMLPNADSVQGLMADVIDGYHGGPGFAEAPRAELRFIAKYLKTVKPVNHEVSGK